MNALRRIGRGIVVLLSISVIGSMAVIFGAIASGYRPVVILTGSMGDTAPPGALVIAAPRAASDIAVGDVLVMSRPGSPTITHRVVEIESTATGRFAITKGDANETIDATPHPLDQEQLVGRWYLPGWGRRLQSALQPQLALVFVGLGVAAVMFGALRRIWHRAPEPVIALASNPTPMSVSAPALRDRRTRRRRHLRLAAVPLTMTLTVGVAWALFEDDDAATANEFGARDCFDPQLGSVQSGTTIHAVDGAVDVAIAPVDPTKAFVMASVRSSADQPSDATVQVRLAGGGSELELMRPTSTPVPPPVTVAWSVVEYSCGITVQRGVTTGDGDTAVDVALSTAPVAQSFALVSTTHGASTTSFGDDHLVVAELSSDTNLRLRAASPVPVGRSLAWQVITFDDPGDIVVQHLGGTVAAGALSTTLSVPAAADPATTFILGGIVSAGDGNDVGARLIRAHLASSTTIEVSRQIAGEALDVSVQVVTLRDGSTVRHGTVDFAAGQPARTVTFAPVDPSRSTAISTVAIPGPVAGGSTDMAIDDVIGEASVTFDLQDERTVQLTRDATTSAASFGWQVIEWAGPGWWDTDWLFRQRIDVVTDTAVAPGGYTVPVVVDHAALVTNGLARADGDDVRLLRWDGMSWTELDRILDDGAAWDSTGTTLLFRTDVAIAAGSTDSYWLYYGNELPPSPLDDAENVFALVEDFDSGNLGDFEDRTTGGSWYQADPFTYRRPLTIPAGAVAADLADFALLVQLTDPGVASAAQADGSDIAFTASDGTTLLAHELESWDPLTGTLSAWVRVPVVTAATDTTVYLYAGAPDAPAIENPRAVWRTSDDAVWHLAEDPAGSAPQVADSGARRLGGLSTGSMTSTDLVSGLAGQALDLDGIDDALDVPAVAIGASGAFTVSAWVRPDTLSADATLLDAGSGSGITVRMWLESVSSTIATVHTEAEIGGVSVTASAGPIDAGSWHHVAAVFDGTELIIFADGLPGTATSATGAVSQPIGTMGLGDGPVGSFDGLLDEVRIDQTAASAARLDGHIANLVDPAFVLEGAPQVGSWLGQGSWDARKPLGIAATDVTGTVNDHAVLVSIDDLEIAASARADGADLVFTASDGVTRLDHVLEFYDGVTGALRAWVAVPLLTSTSDTSMYLYYGNAAARDQQDPVGVFGPDADLALLPPG